MKAGTGNANPSEYEAKFSSFIRMCKEAQASGAEVVVVANPSVLGDNYAELIESFSRLARARLRLEIAAPQ